MYRNVIVVIALISMVCALPNPDAKPEAKPSGIISAYAAAPLVAAPAFAAPAAPLIAAPYASPFFAAAYTAPSIHPYPYHAAAALVL